MSYWTHCFWTEIYWTGSQGLSFFRIWSMRNLDSGTWCFMGCVLPDLIFLNLIFPDDLVFSDLINKHLGRKIYKLWHPF